jgi:hypothetical protein
MVGASRSRFAGIDRTPSMSLGRATGILLRRGTSAAGRRLPRMCRQGRGQVHARRGECGPGMPLRRLVVT